MKEYVICPYCSQKYSQISRSHLERIHNKTSADMKIEFPEYELTCEDLKQKRKDRIKEKYGVENISQLKEVKNKKRNICIQKYGTGCVFQVNEIKDKIKKTCLSKYGVECTAKDKKIREQIKNTRIRVHLKTTVSKFLEENNIILLDEEYRNAHYKHKWKCEKCNIILEKTWNDFQQGYKCPICNPRVYSEYLNEHKDEYLSYRRKVRIFTGRSIKEKYTKNELKNCGPAGKDGAYHIDHRFSITEGFLNDIPAYIIGSPCNLNLVPWNYNNSKHIKCDISKEDLINLVNDYYKQKEG